MQHSHELCMHLGEFLDEGTVEGGWHTELALVLTLTEAKSLELFIIADDIKVLSDSVLPQRESLEGRVLTVHIENVRIK